MPITNIEFQQFKRFLKQKGGILLADNQQYLVANRLSPLMRKVGVDRISDLLSMVMVMPNSDLAAQSINSMTIAEGFGFKGGSHFYYLETKLFAELSRNNNSLSACSIGCSSGQEPYSISFSFEKFLAASDQNINLHVTATSSSVKTLRQAEEGVYTDTELSRGLPPEIQKSHFSGVKGGLQILSSHRSRVLFRQLNLFDSFLSLGSFDVIFCRNVLLYFATPVRVDILNRLVDIMRPGAYLFLDNSEKLPMEVNGLETVREVGCKCYRKY